jgi:DNA-binding CsgD family transcriptional regulator
MTDLTQLERFSDLVGRIYDASVDPDLWPEVVERTCGAVKAFGGYFSLVDSLTGRPTWIVNYGCDPAYLSSFVERYSPMNPFWPLALVVNEGVYDSYELIEQAEYEESLFYKEWAQPQGVGQFLASLIRDGKDQYGSVTLVRRRGDVLFDREDKAVMTFLSEHVRRAVRIGKLFDHQRIAALQFEDCLSAVSTGIILIRGDGKVLFANRAAELALKDCELGQIAHGRLCLKTLALGSIINGVNGQNCFVSALPQRAGDGSPIGLVAFRLGPEASGAYSGSYALFFAGEKTAPRPPLALLSAMYELTGGELRVLVALLEGKSPSAIADTFGISVTTVRTHLLRLFDKTGSSGQTDLVRKVTAIVPPLALP